MSYHQGMPDFPVMLNVRGKRCVIVGGGAVARRRAASLVQAEAEVVVIAPQIDKDLLALATESLPRAYQAGDLEGAFLAIIATNNPQVNEAVGREAAHRQILCNRADDAGGGDFSVPAHAHHGPVTLAAHTSGISPAAAAAIRRALSEGLDPDWPRLLEIVGPYRAKIQSTVANPARRKAALVQLTDSEAMALLKAEGEQALGRHCQALLSEAQDAS